MTARLLVILLALALGLVAVGCSRGPAVQPPQRIPAPPETSETSTPAEPDADEVVRIVGVLEYRDLEGGLWAITGPAREGAAEAPVLAVVANAQDFASELEDLKGLRVIAEGTKAEGASIRMAGPEYVLTSIAGAGDASDDAPQ